MTNQAQYICAEPEPSTMYRDQQGGWHEDRESAIEANFNYDLSDVIEELRGAVPVSAFMDGLRWMIKNHPDMIRILLGDRDPT